MSAVGHTASDLAGTGRAAPRLEVKAPAPPAADLSPAEHYDAIYRAAAGDASAVPWADLRPCPAMVSWLNTQAPGLVRPGSRVVVVGCGLGDDVAELVGRGYDAIGFDISPAAIDWARGRFPYLGASLMHADLLDLPPRLLRRFDLVVEINTIQSLPPALREPAVQGAASLACSKGHLLAICRGRDDSVPLETVAGPPWPLTVGELASLMDGAGLRPAGPIDSFDDDEDPPVHRLRGLFGRC